ncbi:MAG: VCBS domain-containing protein, partial [Vicinamibacterales bacterium]
LVGDGVGPGDRSGAVANANVQHLAEGETATETFTVTIADGHGGTVDQIVTVNIAGTNDAPTISAADNAGEVTEDLDLDLGQLHDSGTITFNDLDLSDTHTVSAVKDSGLLGGVLSPVFVADPATGLGDGTVSWTYRVDNDNVAVQRLAVGQTANETFTVTIDDGHGGTATQTVTITVTGTNDDPTISAADAAGEVTEDDAPLTLTDTGTIIFDDKDLIDTHTVSATAAVTNTLGGVLDPVEVTDPATGLGTGEVTWTYSVANAATQYLDDGESVVESFTVTIDDGHGGTVEQVVNITVHGTGDTAEITAVVGGDYEVTEAASPGDPDASGDLDVVDPDGTLGFAPAIPAALEGTYGDFTFNEATGEWTYTLDNARAATQELNEGDNPTETLTVWSADLSTSHDIVVTVHGKNDAADLSSDTKELVESDLVLSTGGTLTISDVDSPATFVAQPGTAGTYGTFAIDAAGVWTYTTDPSAHDEFEAGETYTDTFSVAAADGTLTSVTVNITGTNDAADLSSDTKELVESDLVLSTGGTLTISDVDS